MNTETNTVQTKSPAQEIEEAKALWLRKNRGIFSEIAKGLDVSESYVRQVFWTDPAEWKSTHAVSKRPEVEAALRASGAPI